MGRGLQLQQNDSGHGHVHGHGHGSSDGSVGLYADRTASFDGAFLQQLVTMLMFTFDMGCRLAARSGHPARVTHNVPCVTVGKFHS